jgi:hypothetical protein
MRKLILFIPVLLAFKMEDGNRAGRWVGAGEYPPGLAFTSIMKKMAADKKLIINIAIDGSVSGNLITVYHNSKANIPNEAGNQVFSLKGKYNADKKSLLLIVTHFRSKPDTSESYLTFRKPDSLYYNLVVSREDNQMVVTGVADKILNKNATEEWVGPFHGGGLDKNMNIANAEDIHVLPLRIRFDFTTLPPSPTDAAYANVHDTIAVARLTNIQRVITLDTTFVKLELYDNGEIDGDIATLVLDGKNILNKQLLGSKPATLYVNLSKSIAEHTLELFADNLGTIPPNTALLVLTCQKKRYEISLSSTETINGAVKLVFKPN